MLDEGSIVSVDVGVQLEGLHADSATTLPVGEVEPEAERLLRVTQESLAAGIAQARLGNHVGDIGHAVQRVAEGAGYGVVRELVGHGIGTRFHEEPQVPNYGAPKRGPRLLEGMTLAIEPMITVGSPVTKTLQDKWTVVTADGSLSAHFEHTVVITANGPRILTTTVGTQPQPTRSSSSCRTLNLRGFHPLQCHHRRFDQGPRLFGPPDQFEIAPDAPVGAAACRSSQEARRGGIADGGGDSGAHHRLGQRCDLCRLMQQLQLDPGRLQQGGTAGRLAGGPLELGSLGQPERVHVLGHDDGIMTRELQEIDSEQLGSLQRLLSIGRAPPRTSLAGW